MEKYTITGHSKLIDEKEKLWGFVVEDNDKNETLLSDDYFSSSIVIALDEIANFLGKPDIKEGQRVKITIETEEDEYFYIWRGWWQRVGKLIYDTWNGETYSTYFPLDEEEEQEFESIYTHEEQ